jgi:DNA-binding MarR family transcriptional regulator
MTDHLPFQSPCYCAELRKASRRVSLIYDARLKASGLRTSQFSLLAEIARDRPVPPTMNELSNYLVMDRSTLGHNLRPLLRKGLVALQQEYEQALGEGEAVSLRTTLHKLCRSRLLKS